MKTILITGCSGEIGQFITKKLLEKKYRIIGLDKSMPFIKNKNFIFYKQDVTDENGLKKLFNEFKNKRQRIDILVNNAAVSVFTPFLKRKKKEATKTLNTNVYASIHLINLFVKNFDIMNLKIGKIINIGSIYGLISPDYRIYNKGDRINSEVYGASKAGLIQLTKYYATFLAKKNILVNCISPGGIENKKKQNKAFIKKYIKNVPLKRMASLSDIFFVLFFLISEENKYMTGQNLILDGGMSSW